MFIANRSLALALVGLVLGSLASADNTQGLARSINTFTFRLIKQTGTPNNKNILISPFSVSSAMGMLIPGTQGSEQSSLVNVIAPGTSPSQAMDSYGPLAHQIVGDGGVVSIANSAWVDTRMKLNASYANSLKANFASSAFPFSHDQSSVNKINGWVDKNTKQMIPKIIDNIRQDEVLFLINAIAFDGQWAHQFEKSSTYSQAFHPLSGANRQVPMMHMTGHEMYYKNSQLRALELKYKGGEFSMLLMLPEKDKDAGALLRSMDPEMVGLVVMSLSDSDKVDIALPKFKFSDSYSLKDPLSAMGLSDLFSLANFSKISPTLKVGRLSRVVHKTFIEVDEKGTKAAAATAVGVEMALARANPPQFIADRPFAFLIIHNPSKAILFAGVVNNPADKS